MQEKRTSNSLPFYLQTVSVALLLLCLAYVAQGQTIFGRISGTVTDSSGAVVPNASVTITNSATNLVRTTTTDDEGTDPPSDLCVSDDTLKVQTIDEGGDGGRPTTIVWAAARQ